MDESGSGSGLNENFSCLYSQLNPHGISSREFWSLRGTIADGRIPIVVLLCVMFCVAVGWNSFVLVVYICKRHLLKEPANILLFTLAITDILVYLIILPFTITVAATGEFIIGNEDKSRCISCSIQGFFFIFLTLVSIHLLAMLSFDRCVLLSNPLKYPRFRKARIWIIAVAIMLLLCFVVSIPPAIGFGAWEFNRNLGICYPRWTPLSNLYYMGVIILEWLFPFLVLLITNIWTCRVISMFYKRKMKRRKSFQQDNIESDNHQKQLFKVFGAILISNTVTWTPIIIMFIAVAITSGEDIPGWVYTVAWFCYLLNPVTHPIIESFLIKELRTRVYKTKKTIRSSVHHVGNTLVRLASQRSIQVSESELPSTPNSTSSNVTMV